MPTFLACVLPAVVATSALTAILDGIKDDDILAGSGRKANNGFFADRISEDCEEAARG